MKLNYPASAPLDYGQHFRPLASTYRPNSAFAALVVMLTIAALVLGNANAFAQLSEVKITEIMAVNNSTLADEDGTYADWIELFNAGTNTVNLEGWYLANDAANLTQWQFPATNLGPNAFLIVFASGKDRRVPGAPLHANFKLDASGEYLALVLPDGLTKVSEFAPIYPEQFADVSYGCPMTGSVSTLVAADAAVRVHVPASDLGTGWRLPVFDDSRWLAGTLGAGFDTSGNYSSEIKLNLETAMHGVNASAYLRVPFTVEDPGAFNALTLRLRYDDGFVAYLNGTEVARRNAPASLAWNSGATARHGAPSPGSLAEDFETTADNFTLNGYGEEPLPLVKSAGPGSTGKFLRLLQDGVNGAANSITFRQTAPGLFETVVADFDFRVSSGVGSPADGFAFLLIPTALYGTNGAGVNVTLTAAEKPNYAGCFGIGFDVYPHNEANDVSVHWNGAEAVNVTIPTSTIDLAAGVFHHAKINLQHVSGGARVTVTLTPDISGTPGPAFSPVQDLYIAGLNPFDARVQFVARTGGLNMGLDIDNCAVQFVPPAAALPFEEFDVSAFRDRLVPGTNVLAFQGLNLSATNSDFLLQPELAGAHLSLAETQGYLFSPTPNRWNGSTVSLTVPTLAFSPLPGVTASNSVTVTLTASPSWATLRYTLDGSEPGSNSLVYTGPLLLTSNTTIRARAELNGFTGDVVGATYFLLGPSVTNFNSNLPLVIIDTQGQEIPDGTKIDAYAVFIDTNTPSGRTTLRSPAEYSGRLGIGLHGNSSAGFPKKNFAIELQQESGEARDFGLLGMPPHNDWLLYPSYSDKSLMNNVLTQELFESMGHYAIRRRYVELFLRRGAGQLSYDDYQGIYIVLERIRVDPNRVNIAKLRASDDGLPEITGGYLFEKDRPEPTDVTFSTSSGQELIILDPKPDKILPAQYDYLKGYVNAFEAALYGANWRDPLTGYATYIEPDSFVDCHWIVEFTKNIDGYRLSNFFYKDRGEKIRNEPIWDWDLSWGNADYADGGVTNGWYYPQVGGPGDIWLSRLRTDPDFYQKIIDRWAVLRSTVFKPANVFARMDRITNYLAEAQVREFQRWPRLGNYVWPNPNGAAGGWDVDYVSPTSYAGIIAQLKHFAVGRFNWVDRQFLPAPTLVTNASSLSFSARAGLIYYTLDGTDPRASGGGVSPSARLYTAPITLTANAGVFARAFYTNAWSAPSRAVFALSVPSLRITEINYHPAAAPTNSMFSEEDFEFIELRNTGSDTINLAGARLEGGIQFSFADNELSSAGPATTNGFDGAGTTFVASKLNQGPGAYVTNGPAGNLLCLLNSGTNISRNRLTFQQTATATNYQRLVTDFDFRARTIDKPSTSRPPTIQDFDSGGTSYTLAGSLTPTVLPGEGASGSNFLRLVPADTGQWGRIAFDRTATGAVGTVVATFDFRVTPPSEANQADGFGFALLNTAVYGASGDGPGFAEEPNLKDSIGIGFDVYSNGTSPAEPNNNHISLHWNGMQVANGFTPTFDFSNGRFHRAQVVISVSDNGAYVTIRLTPDIYGVPGPTETIARDIQIAGVKPYESRVAFAARTGGAWASHDIDNIDVQFLSNNLSAAAALSALFLPSSQFGVSGAGTTLSTFTDFPSITNVLALDLAFNPSDLVNDVSLYWNASLVKSTTLPAAIAQLDAGRFFHVRLQFDDTAAGAYTTLILTPDSLGAPGQPINVLSNFFIPGVTLAGSRLEFAGRNGGLASTIELDNVLARADVLAPLLLRPDEAILVVRNQAAFVSRYGNGFRIAGEYIGSLNNSGDHLVLLGPVGEPILDFTYDAGWYPVTDGAGFTLVAADPTAPAADWGSAGNWRPSTSPLGSPGSADLPRQLIAPVLVNEVLAHPVGGDMDRIELFNPNSTNVDIGGWFLSDSLAQPKGFGIPEATWIPAGGFAVFSAADFNSPTAYGGGFGLNGEGDAVWLFSGDANGELTGYCHGFEFGPTDEGVSIGRYVNSQGAEHFVAQIAPTFATTNSGPRVGPVVITEIMYCEGQSNAIQSDFLNYIELQNIAGAPVTLFSPVPPLTTWHLRGTVDYDFPADVSVETGERILLVGFDPVGDPVRLAAFRAAYPQVADSDVRLFGPWQGPLGQSGGTIELRKPGQLTAAGQVPSVLVERIDYSSVSPWPEAAAGQGSSLQRRNLSGYANDPANWVAASPSPGQSDSIQPPNLVVAFSGSGLELSWPDTAGLLTLEMATNLTHPFMWNAVTNAPELIDHYWRVHVFPPTNMGSFYRLKGR